MTVERWSWAKSSLLAVAALCSLAAVAAAADAPSAVAPAADEGVPADVAADIDLATGQLAVDDRVSKLYGALSIQRIARERWTTPLVSRASLRPWQRRLLPATGHLVAMLADDAPLQWVSSTNDQPLLDRTMSPRREAALALLAIERASVEPLIAALAAPPRGAEGEEVVKDRAAFDAEVDRLLRQITQGGPAVAGADAWRAWWASHQGEPLRNERGRSWLVILVAVLFVAGAGLVFWRLRVAAEKPKRGLPSLAAARAATEPAPPNPPQT